MAKKRNQCPYGRVDKRPNGLWRARYINPEQPKKENGADNLITLASSFATFTEACNALSEVRADMRRGLWKSPEALAAEREAKRRQEMQDRYTFGEYAAQYLRMKADTGQWSESTADRERKRLEKHILPRWEETPLKAITRRDVTQWIATACKGHESQRAHVWGLFRAILNTAIAEEYITEAPFTQSTFKTGKKAKASSRQHQHRALDYGEIYAIADAIGEANGMRHAVLLQAFVGLRPGEVRELRGKDIETLPDGTTVASIERAVTGKNLEHMTVGTPKTAGSVERMPIHSDVAPEIIERARKVGDNGLLAHRASNPAQHLPQNTYLKAFKRAAAQEGIANVCTYCLRHTFISHIAHKADIVTARQLARHTSITTTNRYAHMVTGKAQEIEKAFNDVAYNGARDNVADLDAQRRKA